MIMKFFSIAIAVVAMLVPASQALSVPSYVERAALDVFDPPVISPTTGTVWVVGTRQEVTWDTSKAPVQITNSIGQIMLNKAGIATPVILASNFPILQGYVSIFVPWVSNGTDYQIILFGDSGNLSKKFTITGSHSLF